MKTISSIHVPYMETSSFCILEMAMKFEHVFTSVSIYG